MGEAHGAKLFYFGHSLGGLLGARLATSVQPPAGVDAYILAAPTLRVNASPIERLVVRLCAFLTPWLPLAKMTVQGPAGCTNNSQFAAEMLEAYPQMPFRAAYTAAAF